MDYLAEITKQGFGYLLFAGSLLVLYVRDKQLIDEKDKRIEDARQYKESFVGTARDLLNAQANLQKSIDTVVEVLDTIKWNGKK